MTIRDSLAQVQELKPCPFCGSAAKIWKPEVGNGPDAAMCTNKDCDASVYFITPEHWNNRHGAGDAEKRLRDLHDSIRTVYDAVPSLPVDETTMDAATDALHAFCLLVGIHKIDIDTPTEDAARADERGVS